MKRKQNDREEPGTRDRKTTEKNLGRGTAKRPRKTWDKGHSDIPHSNIATCASAVATKRKRAHIHDYKSNIVQIISTMTRCR